MTAPVSSAFGSAATGAAAATSGAAASLGDKNMFLKLLVAQLKFQNPLQPTDPSTFLAQSAQFSMVEKLGEIATLTQSQQGNGQMLVAASLVGKKVSFDRDGMPSQAVVQAVRIDALDGPMLRVSDSLELPLGAIREVLAPGP